MPIVVRPIQPADYEAAATLSNSADPERLVSAASLRQADARPDAENGTTRYVALAGESPSVVGYGAFWRVRLGQYRLDLLVARAWRRQGVGGRLMHHMLDALALRGAASVQARTSEEDLEALTFLWRHGFIETQRMYRLRLDLAEAPRPTPASDLRLSAQGISIATLAYERAHDPAALRKLYDVHAAAQSGAAMPDPAPTFEEFTRRFGGEAIMPQGFFIARQADRYVGYSGLAVSAGAPGQLQTAGTAVRPEWRRRGIATALKRSIIAFARQHGYATLVTHTADPTLLAINLRLGFRRERAEVRLVLALA